MKGVLNVTFKKLTSIRLSSSTTTPTMVYQADVDTIISKIYIHNPNSTTDIRVQVFFVDTNSTTEYDATAGTINESTTQAFDILVPGLDTVILGDGITLTNGQRIYARTANGDAIIHLFGKLVQ